MSVKRPSKKSAKKAESPKVVKTTTVTEIVNAVTPPESPASANPGGIPVINANLESVGKVSHRETAVDPGGIPYDNDGRMVGKTLAKPPEDN